MDAFKALVVGKTQNKRILFARRYVKYFLKSQQISEKGPIFPA
jgi:hypothetical protein